MISVGILANNPVWEEYLTAFAQGAPFLISGRAEDDILEKVQIQSCINQSDVIWIPELSNNSIEAAVHSLRKSRHVLLGFPVVDFQPRVSQMVNLAREANVEVQVGHHDRYHPAFRAVLDSIRTPQFVRVIHEVKEFIQEDNEQLLLKQILYDVDAILALINHPIKNVQAHVSRITEKLGRVIDIRISFHNGSAASIHFSNLGLADRRIIEITDYQYLHKVNFTEGTACSVNYESNLPVESKIWPIDGGLGMSKGAIDEESLTRECVSFFHRKALNRKPLASIEDGFEALQITEKILRKIGVALS